METWRMELGELFEQIQIDRKKRLLFLNENTRIVRALRKSVQRDRQQLRNDLNHQSRTLARSLQRFVEKNRMVTQRQLSNSRATRNRLALRHEFEVSTATNKRKRTVQSLLRRSASQRRISEQQRMRTTATSMASIRTTVMNLKQSRVTTK
jgi:hypothetical protein